MNTRPRRTLQEELQTLEQELDALTNRVAAIRLLVAADHAQPRLPLVGDRVRFLVAGTYTEGVIIGITAHRVRIRQDTTNRVFLRSPNNITFL
jgi:hypothetical protein